jgi:hypothetical protein
MRMHPGIAQKLNGELLRDKNKPARSCHQVLPISPDLSGPHAVRGLVYDPPLKGADNIRIIRLPAIARLQPRRTGAFGEAKPVPEKQ